MVMLKRQMLSCAWMLLVVKFSSGPLWEEHVHGVDNPVLLPCQLQHNGLSAPNVIK